jgi:AbrB family looped-hinge helix DNA binding protein
MSEDTIIGKRFTLTIPKAIREEIELQVGQRVLLRIKEGNIIIEPLPLDPEAVLKKIVKESYKEESDEKFAEEWVTKHAGR